MKWKLSRILNERKIERRTKAFWTRAQGLKEIERKRFFHLSASALKLCLPDFMAAKLQIMIKRKNPDAYFRLYILKNWIFNFCQQPKNIQGKLIFQNFCDFSHLSLLLKYFPYRRLSSLSDVELFQSCWNLIKLNWFYEKLRFNYCGRHCSNATAAPRKKVCRSLVYLRTMVASCVQKVLEKWTKFHRIYLLTFFFIL